MPTLLVTSPSDVDVLLTWIAMLCVCTGTLMVEALGLVLLSGGGRRRVTLRITAVLACVSAIGVGILAHSLWITRQALVEFHTMRWFPPAVLQWYVHTISVTLPFDEMAVRTAVAVTAVLLLVGVVTLVIARRGSSAARRPSSSPSRQ